MGYDGAFVPNYFLPFTIFANSSIIDVWKGRNYASDIILRVCFPYFFALISEHFKGKFNHVGHVG